MEYLGRTPSPPLDAFIERIWYCSDVPPHTQEWVLPGGGSLDLVVNLAEDEIRIHDSADPGSVHKHPGAVIVNNWSKQPRPTSGFDWWKRRYSRDCDAHGPGTPLSVQR